MTTTPRLDTTRLQRVAKAYWETGALFAAIDLEAFSHIDRGDNTVQQAAPALQASVSSIPTAAGCAGRHEPLDPATTTASTRMPPDVDRFLVKDRRGYAGEWMCFVEMGRLEPDGGHHAVR